MNRQQEITLINAIQRMDEIALIGQWGEVAILCGLIKTCIEGKLEDETYDAKIASMVEAERALEGLNSKR